MKETWITADLTLRPLCTRDRAALGEIFQSSAIKKTYMIPDLPTPEQEDALFARLLARSRDPGQYMRGILLQEKLIGIIHQVEVREKEIELGYALLPAYWGHGYATQALMASIQALFEEGYSRVVCGAFAENPASMRVMEKAGMKKIDRQETILYRDEEHCCLYYAVEKAKI